MIEIKLMMLSNLNLYFLNHIEFIYNIDKIINIKEMS
jgi:hypothetical protein